MTRISLGLATGLINLLTFAVAFPQPAPAALEGPSLQFISGWQPESYRALNLSADGSTVVGVRHFTDYSDVYLWSQSSGSMTLNAAHFSSRLVEALVAPGISADGSVVAFVGDGQLFRWSDTGGVAYLAGPNDLPGGEEVRNVNLSADGSIIYANTSGGSLLRWTAAEGITDLGKPASGQLLHIHDVSADGHCVVGSTFREGGPEMPFRWTPSGGFQELAIPGDRYSGLANAISPDGAIILGTADTRIGEYIAVMWSADNSWLPVTAELNNWSDISADKSVLIGNKGTYLPNYDAYIWSAADGTQKLLDMLTSFGLDTTGWRLLSASAVSDDGLTIVGTAMKGQAVGVFIATIPEPATAALLLSGLVFCARRKRRSAAALSLTILFIACALPVSPTHAAVTYQTVALSGQQAPGLPTGVVFDPPGEEPRSAPGALINNQGQVAFRWNLSGSGIAKGIWTGTAGDLHLAAAESDTIPDAATDFALTIATTMWAFSDSGAMVFGSPPGHTPWLGPPGNIQPVARAGDPAPGAPQGTVFASAPSTIDFFFQRTLVNGSGQTAFKATIVVPGDPSPRSSFWVGSPGSLQLCFSDGEPAPGAPLGATFTGSAWGTINNFGQAVVHASFQTPDAAHGSAIWRVSGQEIEMIALRGQHVPSPGGDRVLTRLQPAPTTNDAGTAAFIGWTSPSSTPGASEHPAVLVGTPASVRVVLEQEDPAPDMPGGIVSNIESQYVPISGAGHIGIRGSYTLGSLRANAVWLGPPDALRLLVHTGQPLPSISADVTADGSTSGLALNSLGQAVIELGLAGPAVNETNDLALMAFDPLLGLVPIAREGDLFEAAPGDWRTISAVISRTFYDSGGQDGLARPINDLGQVVFRLTFTDDTQGVFIATIPEPGTAGLLLLSSLLLCFRKRCQTRLLTQTVVLATCGLGLALPSAHAAVTYQTVALSGQQAPGMPDGVVFAGVAETGELYNAIPPAINNQGQVALRWNVTGPGFGPSTNGRAIWTGIAGDLQLVAHQSGQAPTAPHGITFDDVKGRHFLPINNAGVLALEAPTISSPEYLTRLWTGTAGALNPLLVRGHTVPGMSQNWVFAGPPLGAGMYCVPLLNDKGQVAFIASMESLENPSSRLEGFWIGTADSPQICFRTGDPAPGAPAGSTITVDHPYVPGAALNDQGQAAVFAPFNLPGGQTSMGMWRFSQGQLELLAQKGQQIPTRDGNVTLTSFSFWHPTINNTGQVAFVATTSQPLNPDQSETVVILGTPQNVRVVARPGDPAPGVLDAKLLWVGGAGVTLDAKGEIAFTGTYGSTNIPATDALWLGTPDALLLIAQEGQSLPGLPQDATLAQGFSPRVALNATGQAVFTALLTGPAVDTSNDSLLLAYDPLSGLIPIVREGDLFEVEPGDWRTVLNVSINLDLPTGGQDGYASPLNDVGQIAFSLAFTDNTQGVFIATIPEPATAALLLLSAAAFATRRRRRPVPALVPAAVLAALILPLSSAPAAVTYQTVALSGQQAPGLPQGIVLSGSKVSTRSLVQPAINNQGQLAFIWAVEGPGFDYDFHKTRALWRGTAAGLQLVTRVGQPAPGAPDDGLFFYMYGGPFLPLNDAGQVAVIASVVPGKLQQTQQWIGTPENLSILAAWGEAAPGAPPGWVFREFPSWGGQLLNNQGQSAFVAEIGPPDDPSGVPSLWVGSPGNLHMCFKQGDPAPGAPAGSTMNFAYTPIPGAALNDLGQAAFVQSFNLAGGELSRGLWRASGADMQMIAYRGQTISIGDSPFEIQSLGLGRGAAINNQGQVAFPASLRDAASQTHAAILGGTPSHLEVLAKLGDPVPEAPGSSLSSFHDLALNGAGQIGFTGTYRVDGTLLEGLWLGLPGNLRLITHVGEPLPGVTDVTITAIEDGFDLNAIGQAAFRATLAGSAVDESNDPALLAFDPLAGVIPIVRDGDLFEVSPGDWRTIANFYCGAYTTSSGGEDGHPRALNDLGQIAFMLTFTDNTQGVFIATIPEPATAAILLIGAAARLRRRA